MRLVQSQMHVGGASRNGASRWHPAHLSVSIVQDAHHVLLYLVQPRPSVHAQQTAYCTHTIQESAAHLDCRVFVARRVIKARRYSVRLQRRKRTTFVTKRTLQTEVVYTSRISATSRTSDEVEVHHADEEAAFAVLLVAHHEALLRRPLHELAMITDTRVCSILYDIGTATCRTRSAMRLSTRPTSGSWYCRISGALRSFWYACVLAAAVLSACRGDDCTAFLLTNAAQCSRSPDAA